MAINQAGLDPAEKPKRGAVSVWAPINAGGSEITWRVLRENRDEPRRTLMFPN